MTKRKDLRSFKNFASLIKQHVISIEHEMGSRVGRKRNLIRYAATLCI